MAWYSMLYNYFCKSFLKFIITHHYKIAANRIVWKFHTSETMKLGPCVLWNEINTKQELDLPKKNYKLFNIDN